MFQNYAFKASTSNFFKSAERFLSCLRILIHCLMPTDTIYMIVSSCFSPWWSEL